MIKYSGIIKHTAQLVGINLKFSRTASLITSSIMKQKKIIMKTFRFSVKVNLHNKFLAKDFFRITFSSDLMSNKDNKVRNSCVRGSNL